MRRNLLNKIFGRRTAVTAEGPIQAVKFTAAPVAAKVGRIMLVEVIATGERLHVRDTDAVKLLIAAGQIKPVLKQPWFAPKNPAHFSIQEEYSTGHHVICYFCPTCNQSGRFPGARQDDKLRVWHCGHVGGEAVPQTIQEQYRALPVEKIAAPL